MGAKAEQSNRTREALLEAATRLFGTHGYRAASIKAIAREAGVTHGVIPFHFGSKEGLLLAVVERCFEAFKGAALGAVDKRDRDYGLGDLEAFMQAQANFQDRHPEIGRLFQVLMFEALGPTPELLPHFRGVHERLRVIGGDWVREGQQRGSLDPRLEVAATVDTLLAFFAGARTHSFLFEPGRFDRDAVHSQMRWMLTHGVRPTETTP